ITITRHVHKRNTFAWVDCLQFGTFVSAGPGLDGVRPGLDLNGINKNEENRYGIPLVSNIRRPGYEHRFRAVHHGRRRDSRSLESADIRVARVGRRGRTVRLAHGDLGRRVAPWRPRRSFLLLVASRRAYARAPLDHWR